MVVAMPPGHSAKSSASLLARVPVYQQLHELLRGLIGQGEYRAGDKFPAEREIAERFQVSRVTANKSIASLVTEGVLEFRPGVGTFVRAAGMDYDLRSLMSFTRKAELGGKLPTTKVLRWQTIPAGDCAVVVGEALAVGPTESVHFVERLRLADGVPLILERRHIVAAHCPRLTKRQLTGSLYTLFTEHFGLKLTGATQSLRATNLDTADAANLGVPAGTAALWIRATGFCQHGPLWFEDTLYRGDRYEFHNAIGSEQRSKPARGVWMNAPAMSFASVS